MSRDRSPRSGLFRGAEFPRLMSMVVLLTLVAAMIWNLSLRATNPEPASAAPPTPQGPLPPADAAPELDGLQDRQVMSSRDNPAYRLLLDRVRDQSPQSLRAQARRDVVFVQLLENPARYRGLPVHLEGFARRILEQHVAGSKVFRDGVYYEAYVFTPDSQHYPYIIAFEDLPALIPLGDELQQRVRCDGYFLKLLAYRGGDGNYRFAPLLVGRVEPVAGAPPAGAATRRGILRRTGWLWILAGLATVASMAYLMSRLWRSSGPRFSRASVLGPDRSPAREITAAELAAWVEQAPQRVEPDPDHRPPQPPAGPTTP